ncbi:hypothetical protein TNCT_586511 [Trichonephila clavata]|uniref:Uncharacterized protein n=1 Tax=Trichonephila clavata TaxID=2740835 RepID=A0A8X6K9U1_TRICU|nr:hypothetical protein TNCT_586511 [Trichonephila clavata]
MTKSSITDSDHASNNMKDEPSRNIRFHQRALESSFSFFIGSRSSIDPDEKTQMEDAVRIRISCPRSFFVTKLSLSLGSAPLLIVVVCFGNFNLHISSGLFVKIPTFFFSIYLWGSEVYTQNQSTDVIRIRMRLYLKRKNTE